MEAIVYKSTGSWYIVHSKNGEVHNARIKGKFKIDNITSTNPLAVGDFINIEKDESEGDWMITEIFERRNYINRVSPHNVHRHHIVAANLDQSLLFATLKSPKTSFGFIDRFFYESHFNDNGTCHMFADNVKVSVIKNVNGNNLYDQSRNGDNQQKSFI